MVARKVADSRKVPIFEQEKIALKILKTEYAGHAPKYSSELDF